MTYRWLSVLLFCTVGALCAYGLRDRFPLIQRATAFLWVETAADAQYGPFPENRIRVERPRWNRRPDAPAVLVFHGGAWKAGNRQEMEERVCRRYLEAGFLVGNVEYRLGVKAPAAVEDALRAAAWFAGAAPGFGANPEKIVVTGESAGAHLALMVGMLGRDSELGHGARVAAVVNFYGISDLRALLEAGFVRDWLPGGPESAGMAERMSPLGRVTPQSPPVLSLHGTEDDVVPIDQSRRLTEAMHRAGAPAVFVSLAGAHHGFSTPELATAYGAVLPFLREQRILAN